MGTENEQTEQNLDVENENPSSESSTEGGTDVQKPDSSSEDQPSSMLEVATKIYEDSVDETAKPEEGDVLSEDSTEPEGEVESEEEGETTDDPADSDPDAKLPFAKHKRFQEVLSKAKERDAFEQQAKSNSEKAKQWEYHQRFVEQHDIAQEDIAVVMNALAYAKTDPEKARQLLEPLVQSLQEVNPNVLPNDLQQQVKEGEISEAMAKRLWAAECKNRVGQRSGTSAARKQQIALAESLQSTVSTWEANTRKANPGFMPSKTGGVGLFEITSRNFSYHLANANEPHTPALYLRCLEQAYKEARALLSTAKKPAPTRKVPNTRMSVPGNKSKEHNPDAEIAAVAKKYGMNFSRNGEETE